MTTSDIHAGVLNYAQQYKHNPAQPLVLEPHKEAVILLRAKYASYEIIAEVLTTYGVQVSVATVRKFCRRHHGEVRRVRAAHDAERKDAAKAAVAPPTSAGPASSAPEFNKRGPRIARDEL